MARRAVEKITAAEGDPGAATKCLNYAI